MATTTASANSFNPSASSVFVKSTSGSLNGGRLSPQSIMLPRRKSSVTGKTKASPLPSDLPPVDLSKYRLPNLLENKLRRLAMREQKKRLPKKEAAKTEIKDDKLRRLKKKKKGLLGLNSMTPGAGPAGRTSVGSNSSTKRVSAYQPGTTGPNLLQSKLRNQFSSISSIDSASEAGGNQSKVPVARHPSIPFIGSEVNPALLYQLRMSRLANYVPRKKSIMPVDPYVIARTSYGRTLLSSAWTNREEETVEDGRTPLGRRGRLRKREVGPKPILTHVHPDTIAKQNEVDDIIEAFERHEMEIERKVVEKALIHPENIFLPLLQVKKEGENDDDITNLPKTPSDVASGSTTSDTSRLNTPGSLMTADSSTHSRHGRRRRNKQGTLNIASLLVKPYEPRKAKEEENQNDINPREGSRIQSWWTAEEFKTIKRNVRDYRRAQRLQKEQNRYIASREYKPQAKHHPDAKEIAVKSTKFRSSVYQDESERSKRPQVLPNQDDVFVSAAVDAMARLSLVAPRPGRITPIRPHSALSRPSVTYQDASITIMPEIHVNGYVQSQSTSIGDGFLSRPSRKRAVSESMSQTRNQVSFRGLGVDYVPSTMAGSRATDASRGTTMSIFSDLSSLLHSRASSTMSAVPQLATTSQSTGKATGAYLQTSYGRPRFSVL